MFITIKYCKNEKKNNYNDIFMTKLKNIYLKAVKKKNAAHKFFLTYMTLIYFLDICFFVHDFNSLYIYKF